MKRVRLNYHNLQTAENKLRKAIFSNCERTRELFKRVCLERSERQYKVERFINRELHKPKAALRNVVVRHVSVSGKKRLIVQRGGFLLPVSNAVLPTIDRPILRNKKNILHMKELIQSDRLHEDKRSPLKKRIHHPYEE